MLTKLKFLFLYLKNFLNFIFKPSPRWVSLEDYEGIYEISNFGEIYNIKEMKSVSTFTKKDGYVCVALTDRKGKVKQHRLHRLVAKTFLYNFDNKSTVKHKDGNKLNNNVNNLYWV